MFTVMVLVLVLVLWQQVGCLCLSVPDLQKRLRWLQEALPQIPAGQRSVGRVAEDQPAAGGLGEFQISALTLFTTGVVLQRCVLKVKGSVQVHTEARFRRQNTRVWTDWRNSSSRKHWRGYLVFWWSTQKFDLNYFLSCVFTCETDPLGFTHGKEKDFFSHLVSWMKNNSRQQSETEGEKILWTI